MAPETNAPGGISTDPVVAAWLQSIHTGMTSGFLEMRTALAGKADKSDVDQLRRQLDGKADKADISPLIERLDHHGEEIGRLKDRQRDDESETRALQGDKARRSARWKWWIGTSLTLPFGVLSLLQILTWLGVHV